MELTNPRIFKKKYFYFTNMELANPRIIQKNYFTFTNIALKYKQQRTGKSERVKFLIEYLNHNE